MAGNGSLPAGKARGSTLADWRFRCHCSPQAAYAAVHIVAHARSYEKAQRQRPCVALARMAVAEQPQLLDARGGARATASS